jgi:spermidine synthase
MFGFGKKVHRSVSDSSHVEVSEVDGIRSLYIDTNTIQSSMRVKAPYELVLAYSRGMMAFLLFLEDAREVLMIGLGGGSVAKYIWRHCPSVQQTVVEISEKITNLARSHFYVPENDDRFNVIFGDGIEFLQNQENSTQVLMIDAFDGVGIPPDFCTQVFFDDCAAVLKDEGLFVINLWGSDKNFGLYWQRIENSFDGKVLKLPTGKPGNIIVFGFKTAQKSLNMKGLVARAKTLDETHALNFSGFVETLFEYNAHHQQKLFFGAEPN